MYRLQLSTTTFTAADIAVCGLIIVVCYYCNTYVAMVTQLRGFILGESCKQHLCMQSILIHNVYMYMYIYIYADWYSALLYCYM